MVCDYSSQSELLYTYIMLVVKTCSKTHRGILHIFIVKKALKLRLSIGFQGGVWQACYI